MRQMFFSVQTGLQLCDLKLVSHFQGEYTHFYDAKIVLSYILPST